MDCTRVEKELRPRDDFLQTHCTKDSFISSYLDQVHQWIGKTVVEHGKLNRYQGGIYGHQQILKWLKPLPINF